MNSSIDGNAPRMTPSIDTAAPKAASGLAARLPWAIALVAAIILPWLFYDWSTGKHSGFALTLLSEIGLMCIFALSYNMQMGQAGLLSFGHAILFGLSGYAVAHLLNAIIDSGVWFPLEAVPLAGGFAGLGFGIVFGYLATKQRSTAFAMITLGLGELVTAAAMMFMGFFGGEGGISTNRVIEHSLFGLDYIPAWQVYYLIAGWAFIATVLMKLQTQTPLGRMANAQRDNFERTQFVGYDPRRIRFYQYALSGFFAGIAGALFAILYEIVTFDAVAAPKSAAALLASYIGGGGAFFGPVIGAFVVVLIQSGISLVSSAWMLYIGVLFILVVIYAPGGVAGILGEHAPILRAGRLRELLVPYLRLAPPVLLVLAGFVLLVELTSYSTIGAARGKDFSLAGIAIDTTTMIPWALGVLLLVGGGLWLRREIRVFSSSWNALLDSIKTQAKGQR